MGCLGGGLACLLGRGLGRLSIEDRLLVAGLQCRVLGLLRRRGHRQPTLGPFPLVLNFDEPALGGGAASGLGVPQQPPPLPRRGWPPGFAEPPARRPPPIVEPRARIVRRRLAMGEHIRGAKSAIVDEGGALVGEGHGRSRARDRRRSWHLGALGEGEQPKQVLVWRPWGRRNRICLGIRARGSAGNHWLSHDPGRLDGEVRLGGSGSANGHGAQAQLEQGAARGSRTANGSGRCHQHRNHQPRHLHLR